MDRKGVTLIELIVVMVIIAIGALLMAPNIGAMLTKYRLRTASRDIVSTMRTAQMKAVSTNMEYRVSFTIESDRTGSYILQRNTGGIWVDEGVTQPLPKEIKVEAITFPGDNAQFNTNSTASTGSLTLKNSKGTTTRITVTASTGRIKIE
jgi:prepilin-type N-terminal cleavage/methylation domain-containing protein